MPVIWCENSGVLKFDTIQFSLSDAPEVCGYRTFHVTPVLCPRYQHYVLNSWDAGLKPQVAVDNWLDRDGRP